MGLLGDILLLVVAGGYEVLLVVERGWDRGPHLSVLVGGPPFRPLLATRLVFAAWGFYRIF